MLKILEEIKNITQGIRWKKRIGANSKENKIIIDGKRIDKSIVFFNLRPDDFEFVT